VHVPVKVAVCAWREEPGGAIEVVLKKQNRDRRLLSPEDEASHVAPRPKAEQVARRAIKANGRGQCFAVIAETEDALAALSLAEDVAVAAPLRQQLALALARAGALGEAGEVLRDLLVASTPDGETFGLLGSVSKRLSESVHSQTVARAHLQNARDFYEAGLTRHLDPYCGINAAACSALLGDREAADVLAGKVLSLSPTGDAYWDAATRAEALLLQGSAQKALDAYTEAVSLAGKRRADLATTRKQCRRLCAQLYGDASLLDAVFGKWSVAMVAGSAKGAAKQDALVQVTTHWLRQHGVVSLWLTGEADPLFGVAAMRAEVEVCVILPGSRQKFLEHLAGQTTDSVQRDWNQLLVSASSVTELAESSASYGCDPRLLLQCLTTSAASRASVLDTDLEGLLYGHDTLSAVEFWQRLGAKVELMDSDGAISQAETVCAATAPSGAIDGETQARQHRIAEDFRALARLYVSQRTS